MTAWDRHLVRQCSAWSGALGAVALVTIMAATGGASTPARFAVFCVFVPVCAAIGGYIALRVAEHRGELVALGALGASPFRMSRGMLATAGLCGAVATTALATSATDPSAVFPRSDSLQWTDEGGVLTEARYGVRYDGRDLVLIAIPTRANGDTGERSAAVLLSSLLTLLLPSWLSVSRSRRRRIVLGACVTASVLALAQSAGRDLLSPAWVGAPLLVLLADLLSTRSVPNATSR